MNLKSITGWRQLATLAYTLDFNLTEVVIPSSPEYRKYVIGIPPAEDGVPIAVYNSLTATVPSFLSSPDKARWIGPFTRTQRLWIAYPAATHGYAVRITPFISIKGEIDELVRYLKDYGSDAEAFVRQIETWEPDQLHTVTGLGLPTSGTRNNHPIQQFPPDLVTGGAFYSILPINLPVDWLSGVVRLIWAGSVVNSNGDQVRWAASIERDNEGFDIDADSFDTESAYSAAVPATAGALAYTDIVFANPTGTDDVLPGEAYRLKIRRIGDHADDDYAGDAQLQGVSFFLA